MVTTEGDQEGLRMTNLKKLANFSRCVIRDVAPLKSKLFSCLPTLKACGMFCRIARHFWHKKNSGTTQYFDDRQALNYSLVSYLSVRLFCCISADLN